MGDGLARNIENRAERCGVDSVTKVEVEVADLVDAQDDGCRTSPYDLLVGCGDLLSPGTLLA